MTALYGLHTIAQSKRGESMRSSSLKCGFFTFYLALLFFLVYVTTVIATPSGPTMTLHSNETYTPLSGSLLNTTGGSISTLMLNATSQNLHWKAYVGNVTGKLALQDLVGSTIYDWQVTAATGMVYATRKSTTANWTNINCSNATHLRNEDIAMNHTNKDDNISKTFNLQTHDSFFVGSKQIPADYCFSLYTYVNNGSQATSIDEVALYDGTNSTNGYVVYGTVIEVDHPGFDNQTYDFQMIIPEKGIAGWSSSTAYYFYVEITG